MYFQLISLSTVIEFCQKYMSTGTMLLFLITLLAFLLTFKAATMQKKHLQYRNADLLPPSPLALPVIGHLHLLSPLIHHSFHKLSTLYGPLIHLKLGSVPCIIASSPNLAKEFLKTHELNFSSRKHTLAIDRLTYNSAFAFAPYGPYWKFIKKLTTAELVGNKVLNGFSPLRKTEYIRFLRMVMRKSMSKQPLNVTEELLKLTNSVICQMMLSIRCSDTNGQAEEARGIVRDVTKIFGEFNVSDLFWFCKNLDLQGVGKKTEEIFKKYDGLLGRIIKEREELREKKKREKVVKVEVKDFLDTLLDVMEDAKSEVKITKDHIKALVLDFFTAATDTTAIAVEWALAELINNPTILKKARDEIEQVVGKNRLVQETDNLNLQYIQAIIKETFRLHPPIPLLSRKSVESCTIDGCHIPGNTLLFVNIWSIGRNSLYWDKPMEFRPERFFSGPSENIPAGNGLDVKGQDFELLPFGSGRRGCPGMNLAMIELPTILGTMIQCFDWNVVGLDGGKMNNGGGDENVVVDMSERPGLTAPRVQDLVCFPVARVSPSVVDL